MAIPIEQLQDILERSLSEFFEREAATLLDGVSERSSCCRLANYMERIVLEAGLNGYIADTEYNRKQGGQVKTILDGNLKAITITADLILHSRGTVDEDNLIAIEMKKADRPDREKESDRERLRAMTKSPDDEIWPLDAKAASEHVCGYRLGAYIELNNRTRKASIEYFIGGEPAGSVSRSY
jgi:hypothetical protein